MPTNYNTSSSSSIGWFDCWRENCLANDLETVGVDALPFEDACLWYLARIPVIIKHDTVYTGFCPGIPKWWPKLT